MPTTMEMTLPARIAQISNMAIAREGRTGCGGLARILSAKSISKMSRPGGSAVRGAHRMPQKECPQHELCRYDKAEYDIANPVDQRQQAQGGEHPRLPGD